MTAYLAISPIFIGDLQGLWKQYMGGGGGKGMAFEQAFIISAAADTRISHHGKIWDELRRGLTGVWLYQW